MDPDADGGRDAMDVSEVTPETIGMDDLLVENALVQDCDEEDEEDSADIVVPAGVASVSLLCKFRRSQFHLVVPVCLRVYDLKADLAEHTNIPPGRMKLGGLKAEGVRGAPSDDTLLSECKLTPDGVNKLMVVGTPDADLFQDRETVDDDVVNDLDVEMTASGSMDIRCAENMAKLDAVAAETDFRILHPPREGKRLLVLDLDYTLFDMKGRAEHIDELKRPYLEEFLTIAYRSYDIVVWSQTKWTWLEMKLTDLGLLTSPNYKLTFVLDISSMFKINGIYKGEPRRHSVKPLEVVWRRFPDRWGPHNTIHVDDVSRNFALNPQSGLKIRAFKRAHINRATDRELVRLAKYLHFLATSVDDFSQCDHSEWKKVVRRLYKQG